MKKLILLYAFLLTSLAGMAGITTISGKVSGAGGQVIRLLAFEDFISGKMLTLASSEIGQEGRFMLEASISEVTHVYLDINYQRAEFFLEPGVNYELNVRYHAGSQLASYFDRQGLEYDYLNQQPGDLNNNIWKFNSMYNRFIMEDFERIVTLHDKSLVSKFREAVRDTFGVQLQGYFGNYVTYKLADVEQFARLKGKNLLAEEYFTGKPILYGNVEYTYFFSQFFEKFLITSPDVITISDLIIAVNEKTDLDLLRDALKAVPYLSDPVFRELVLLHGLKELYHNGTFKKDRVLELIRRLKAETASPRHRNIAANLLTTLPRLSPGSAAPDISLTLADGSGKQLHEIKGKPILLVFYRIGQKGMEREFDILSEMFSSYKAGLEIISISMDDEGGPAFSVFGAKYPWTFAHYGNRPEVYDRYNIRNLPLYVLINAEGNIAACPAPGPGDELEREVMKVMH